MRHHAIHAGSRITNNSFHAPISNNNFQLSPSSNGEGRPPRPSATILALQRHRTLNRNDKLAGDQSDVSSTKPEQVKSNSTRLGKWKNNRNKSRDIAVDKNKKSLWKVAKKGTNLSKLKCFS